MHKNRKKYLKLQYYRKKYGYRQCDMAKLVGVCQSGYSHKENGRVPFSFDEMKSIYDVLNNKARKLKDPLITLDQIFLE